METTTDHPTTRIFCLLARKAPVGVVFRRGPSKQVQLLRWNLHNDAFEGGQWLKGRIYERRCDLSPSGRLLLYFAGTHKPPFGTWTAVSRPPFFTALALWPKGDAWGGGGLFEDDRTILLNHRDDELKLGPKHSLPHRMRVKPFGQYTPAAVKATPCTRRRRAMLSSLAPAGSIAVPEPKTH